MLRWVSVLLVSIALVGCSRDPEVAKQEYLHSGDQYFADGHYDQAIVEYRNAIRIDSQFGLARYQLARAYARIDDAQRAADELFRAADLLPDDSTVQLDAARMLLRLGRFRDARGRADGVLQRDRSNVQAHILRGRASAGLREFDTALQAFESGLAAHPERGDIHVDVGLLMSAQGDHVEAEAAFKQAVAVAPTQAAPRIALAEYYWSTSRISDAERMLGEALGLEPDHLMANRAMAMLYLATNRVTEAEAPLRRAAASTDASQPKLVLADYYIALERHADAAPILDELLTRPDMLVTATARRAGLEDRMGRRPRAHAMLDDLLSTHPRAAEALVAKGQLLMADGRITDAIAIAERAIAADGRSWQAHELLGSSRAALGSLDQATEAFTEALRLSPRALHAQIGLANLNTLRGRTSAAMEFAEQAIRTQPGSAAARFALVRAVLSGGDLSRAQRELAPLLRERSEVAAVHVLHGELETERGALAAARQAFERAATLDPASTEALAGLLKLDIESKHMAGAVARVERFVAATPPSAAALSLAGQTYLSAGDLPRAEASVARAIDLDPDYRAAYDLLSTIYMRQRKFEPAQQMYERLVERRPTDVPALTMIGVLFDVQRKREDARRAYERALSVDPRAGLAANNLAFLYADEGRSLDLALTLAQTARAALPDDAAVSNTLGWVYFKQDLPVLAIEYLRESARRDPRNPTYHYHLGLAYLKAKDPDNGRASLRRALALDENFEGAVDARRALASIQG